MVRTTQTRKKYAGRPDMPELMSVRMFAHHLGKGEVWVRQACKDGRILACQKVGNNYVIAKDTLIRPRYMQDFPGHLLDVDLPPEFILGTEPYEVPMPEYRKPGNPDRTRDPRRAVKLHSFRHVFMESEMSYHKLQHMASVSGQTINKALNGGRVAPEVAVRLANALGVDISELLRYRDE
jgi:hypothetical protein